jgi:prepilin-type N-terminal cleavage/methylation domain-containing protein
MPNIAIIKNKINIKKNGFTLIELLVVISIIGVLATLIITNINEARARARDVAKKDGMSQLKTALRLYYNDFTHFPASCGINTIQGCGATGTTCCPVSGCPEFSAGGTGCSTVYMNKFPTGLGSNTIAFYSDGNEKFCIKATLENASDPDIATSYTACNTICTAVSAGLKTTEYSVCSD